MFYENLGILGVVLFLSPFVGEETPRTTTTVVAADSFEVIAEVVAEPHPEVSPELILAIGDRESHLGALLDEEGLGDNGNGCGWMQIDKRYHAEFVASVDCASDHLAIAKYAINEVYLPYLQQLDGNQEAALAAYNAGVSSVKEAMASGQPVDSVTTGGDYSWDVGNRMEEF